MKPRPSTNKKSFFHVFTSRKSISRENIFTLAALAAAFVAAALIVIFALQFEQIFPRYNIADFKPEGTAPYELVPEHDIVWVDEEKTLKKRNVAERGAFPVFQYDDEKTGLILKKFEILRDFITARQANGQDDPVKGLRLQNLGATKLLSEQNLSALLSLTVDDLMQILEHTETVLVDVLNNGILSWSGIDRDPVSLDGVAVIRGSGGVRIVSEKSIDDIITLQSLPLWLESRLRTLNESARGKDLVKAIILSLADENVVFNQTATAANRRRARETVAPVREIMRKNFPIVGKGQSINAESYSKVLAFSKATAAEMTNRIVSTILFLAVIVLTAAFLMGPTFARRAFTRGETLFCIVLGLIYLALSVLVYRLTPLEGDFPLSLFLPTAMVTVIATIIFSPYAGLAYSFILASLALLIQNDLSVFLFAFFSGLAATAAVTRVEKRIDLVKAGFILFAVQGIIMFIISVMGGASWSMMLTLVTAAALNGFFSLIASLGFLPLSEHLLNAPTRFRLMELSDPNVPILKKMLVLAPGTYTHSINVANLAESAAMAVRANPPLARVGAYYHDIGKVDQPEYFIENQADLNKHDLLKPSLSAAVIKSHVKIGVEKAKELDLPQAVIDIIAQHHGKGLISYFFSRARSENGGQGPVSPEDFSYQGRRPQTKEAAIVMLADAVEAASRSLKKPTPAKVEKLVWQIIEERFHSEELLECNLTLHELEVIKQVFVQIVQGYLHQRIEYPKVKENGK